MSIVEEAVQWVDEHRGKIVNFGKKYLEFTPYDRGSGKCGKTCGPYGGNEERP